MRCLVAGAFALSIGLIGAAQAGVITTDYVPQTTGAGWYSSELGDFNRQAKNISNNSFAENTAGGQTGPGHTNLPSDSMWLTTVPGYGGTDSDPFIVIDLGAEYTVDRFQVWNYNEVDGNTVRGVRQVEILSSTGERTMAGDGAPTADTFVSRGMFDFVQAPGTDGYTGESLAFGSSFTARYIKLDINSNWGGDGYGLSEIQFNEVPEPASIGLLGAAGLMALRRRRAC